MTHTQQTDHDIGYHAGYLDALRDLVSHVENQHWIISRQRLMTANAIAQTDTTNEV